MPAQFLTLISILHPYLIVSQSLDEESRKTGEYPQILAGIWSKPKTLRSCLVTDITDSLRQRNCCSGLPDY